MLRSFILKSIAACVVICVAFGGIVHESYAASFKLPKLKTVIGGNLRLPHSLQPRERDNIYFETFVRVSLPVWTKKKFAVSLFAKSFLNKDTLGRTFNNKSVTSLGLSYDRKVSKTFSVRATLQYDWDFRALTGQLYSGPRVELSYFYYKDWWRNKPKDLKGWHRQTSWARVWGKLTYPESLKPGNNNLFFITGGEIATAYVWRHRKMQYVPFAELIYSKDHRKQPSNNKIIPAVGFKFRRPIKGGEISLGIKYALDRRWIAKTTETGKVIFAGWYKSF